MFFSFDSPYNYIALNIKKELKSIKDIKHTSIDIAKMRNELKILIIDDEGFAYKELLTNRGYTKIKIEQDLTSIRDVENHDFILCDITGVGNHISKGNEGFAIVDEIKKNYPTKFVYIYTGIKIDTSKYDLYKNADGQLSKESTIEKIVEVLDKSIDEIYNPKSQWMRMRRYLLENNVSITEIALMEDSFVRYVNESRKDIPQTLINSIEAGSEVKDALKSFFVQAIKYFAIAGAQSFIGL